MNSRNVSDQDVVLHELRRQGKRITGQRKVILDIILRQNWENCKDIYYEAIKVDSSIGIATVYRMLDTLEELGVLQKRCSYYIDREMIEKCRMAEC
ncbi:MAG: transcriptional repressor [Eubacterium sp.]|nr:transcriptional repressor [Eubacterium sp.]